MFLEYGVNQHNELIHIEQAGRGLTELSCPYCGGRLLAKKGSEKIHHFAHAGETCREVSDRSDTSLRLPLYDKFDLGLSQKELVILHKNHYFEMARAEKGIALRDGKYGTLYLQYFDMEKELISHRENIEERLAEKGFLFWNEFTGRSGDYQFTQLGKVPVGAAMLQKFAEIQDRQFTDRHKELEQEVETAWISQHNRPNPEYLAASLADLNIYRAQLRRVFSASLYFLEISHSNGRLYKVGISSRPLEERIEEIRRDLASHLSGVQITILRKLQHRGAIEFYFKYRYRHEQNKLGSLTEYFAFNDRKKVLSDLTKLGDYRLDVFMQAIIEGQPSPIEKQIEEENQQAEAQASAEQRRQAISRGMRKAAEKGQVLGRPSKATDAILAEYPQVVELLGQGIGIREVSRLAGVARNTVRKVKNAMEG